LLNSYITWSIAVKTFRYWDDNPLSLWSDQLPFHEFENPTHIFSTFLCDELYQDFYVLLICLIFDGDLLIEYEFIGWRGRNFGRDGRTVELEVYFTRELNFETQVEYVDSVGIDLYFLLDWHVLKIDLILQSTQANKIYLYSLNNHQNVIWKALNSGYFVYRSTCYDS